ncbi:MAG: RluA family pseudouridine synthase [Alphaproteobacteria bacterium]
MEENNLIYEVCIEDIGIRADKYLGQVCDVLSRSRLQGLIADGKVLLDGEPLKQPSLKTEQGNIFTVHIPEPEKCEPEAEDIPLDIVYEDDDVIVINKAAGLVVHPGAGNWTGTLVNALLFHCGDSLSGIGGVVRPGIVHRLDKDTSGLIMVAKNDHAHQHLSEQLADRTLSRVYHALVFGIPMPVKGSVDRAIGRHRHDRLKMSVMSNSPREARTHYRVLERYGEACSLVECKLESGRTHQIRVHMEALGNPVIGDALYGVQPTGLRSNLRKSNYSPEIIENIMSLDRQMLHAKEICFVHPVTEEDMSFSCDLPDGFSNALKMLYK